MTVNDLITAFGGTGALAQILGVRPSAVSNWRKNGLPDKASLLSRLQAEAKNRGLSIDVFMVASIGGGSHDQNVRKRA